MKYKILGFLILAVLSTIYAFKTPTTVKSNTKKALYVTLEGSFNKSGEVEIEEGMRMKELVRKVGVKKNANLDCLDMNRVVRAEARYYLPIKKSNVISLNKASKEDFMKLDGIGAKTAEKIIEYRKNHVFTSLEDIMNIEGIGEKRYLTYRDQLCL